MKYEKKIYWSIAWIILGAVLIVLSAFGVLDEFWNGAGSGLVVVSIIQLIRQMR